MTAPEDTGLAAGATPPAVVAALPDVDPLLAPDEEDRNRARVGSLRPSALLYTGGIGATVDLPHFSVLVRGLDAWDYVYRRQAPQLINEPRLLREVRRQLMTRSVEELRQLPWRAGRVGDYSSAEELGVPVAVFPQWLRCTGCDMLARVDSDRARSEFTFDNHNPFRPDQAVFQHQNCRGRPSRRAGTSQATRARQPRNRRAVPARYLLACQNGHLDEFPYMEWVHHAAGTTWTCRDSSGRLVPNPKLIMSEYKSNLGPMVRVRCLTCGQERNMKEAVAAGAAQKLPGCRGFHAHLGVFEQCDQPTRLLLLGASNQWFPAVVSILALTNSDEPTVASVSEMLSGLPRDVLETVSSRETLPVFRILARQLTIDLTDVDDELLWRGVTMAKSGQPTDNSERADSGLVSIMEPEWDALRRPELLANLSERAPFKVVSKQVASALSPLIQRVVAVEKLKKVNAFIGFTRIDPVDRISDARTRLAPISRRRDPRWVPATEDRGEGIFIQVDEDWVSAWEDGIRQSDAWEKHRAAHYRNFRRRLSSTAQHVEPDTRLPPPRYWALHTLSHLLIRQIAMHAGYGSASLSERIYAWQGKDGLRPAAGILITTTAPDSEGTLGGLVELATTAEFERIFIQALLRAERCSSDPICAGRLPEHPEDFLHGAACHFCTFASETSCERANRFLDRRFVLTLPHGGVPGLFQGVLST